MRHVEGGFRPDVEGLRAVAVAAVIGYHAGVPGFRGGFVGVDMFFVVSGFLITRLILGEVASTGAISLHQFWARRARRLLPTAALTVVVTVIAAQRLLPPLSLTTLATDAVAAGTFTANFVFADRLGDYFGAQLGASNPSPLLHFWSLAVEEQFYLCWPPLLVLLLKRPRQYRRLVLATIAVVAAFGVTTAIVLTSQQPSWAFFLLPARMAGLLAGAALAALGTSVMMIPRRLRGLTGWVGLALIATCVLVIDESVPWPGIAVALPVLATMAVIVGGTGIGSGPGPSSTRLLAQPGLQWIGRHSYALYLWHWPALVLAEARLGPLTWAERGVAVGMAVALSVLSVQLVENPIRHSPWIAASAWRSLALGAATCALVVAAGHDLRRSIGPLDGGVAAAAPELEAVAVAASAADPDVAALTVPLSVAPTVAPASSLAQPTATAPAAVAPDTTLATPAPPTGRLGQLVASTQRTLATASAPAPVPSNLSPSLAAARQRSQPYDEGCVNIGRNAELQPCEYGVAAGGRTILLFGDSHAVQWFEPLQQLAIERGYRLVLLAKGGCPVAEVDVPTPVLRYTCTPYRDRAIAWIERNHPDLVIAANSYTQYPADAEEWAEGTEATVGRLADTGVPVVLLGDNPASVEDPPACLSSNLDDASACATARDEAVRADRISAEVAAAAEHGVTFVDTTDWFCTAESCPPIVGNVLVLRDGTHITATMAMFLQPLLAAAIDVGLD